MAKKILLSALVLATSTACMASGLPLTLAADTAPAATPWNDPASLTESWGTDAFIKTDIAVTYNYNLSSTSGCTIEDDQKGNCHTPYLDALAKEIQAQKDKDAILMAPENLACFDLVDEQKEIKAKQDRNNAALQNLQSATAGSDCSSSAECQAAVTTLKSGLDSMEKRQKMIADMPDNQASGKCRTQAEKLKTAEENLKAAEADLDRLGKAAAEVARNTPVGTSTLKITGYDHRDTTSTAPVNNRGGKLGYSQIWLPTTSSDQYGLDIKGSFGKTLTNIGTDQTADYQDIDKDREILLLSYYNHRKAPFYFTVSGGLYADSSHGSKANGRVNGSNAAITFDFMPWAADDKNHPIAPLLELTAQEESDYKATGARKEDFYPLYKASLSFPVLGNPNPGGTKFAATLALTRSVGSDMLAGQGYARDTSLSLGFVYQ